MLCVLSCCVSLSCCTQALLGLAVILGSAKGFHLEAPAWQGRGERVVPTLAVGTAGTVQPWRLIWVQPSAGQATHAWDWNLLRKVFACGAASFRKVQCTVRPPNSLEGKGAGRWRLALAGTYLYISPGSSQANSYAHAVSVVLRFISELEARVKEHPGDPGT